MGLRNANQRCQTRSDMVRLFYFLSRSALFRFRNPLSFLNSGWLNAFFSCLCASVSISVSSFFFNGGNLTELPSWLIGGRTPHWRGCRPPETSNAASTAAAMLPQRSIPFWTLGWQKGGAPFPYCLGVLPCEFSQLHYGNGIFGWGGQWAASRVHHPEWRLDFHRDIPGLLHKRLHSHRCSESVREKQEHWRKPNV